MLDEFTRRCLAIVVARRLKSDDVLHCLADLFVRTDRLSISGPTTARIRRPKRVLVAWPDRRKTLYIEPGRLWENGYCESLNSKLRDKLLNAMQAPSIHVCHDLAYCVQAR